MELIHLHPNTSSRLPESPSEITLGDTIVTSKDTIRLLGITIRYRFTFRQQPASAITKSQNLLPFLQRMAFSRGASMSTLLSPTLTWGSDVWRTGAQHIIDKVNPTYHRFKRLITGLPSYKRSDKLLSAAGIPPHQPLLDIKSRNYAIRLLPAPNDHPTKTIHPHATLRKGVGMGRIKALLMEIIPPGSRLEIDLATMTFLPAEDISIPSGTKESVAKEHRQWLSHIPNATIVYTDGS